MTRQFYPCGVMFVGERLVQHARGIDGKLTTDPPYQIHPSGRSLSRLLRAGEQALLTFSFTEAWKIGTICCLGPCLLVKAIVTPYIVYPYPQRPPDSGALFVIADRILEADHPLMVELECSPSLFMLEREDEDDRTRSGFVDSKGVVHGQ
jgi:hypothetical protein